MEHIHPLSKENTMFNSKFTRLNHVVEVACTVFYTIYKTNIELAKFVAREFKTIMTTKPIKKTED